MKTICKKLFFALCLLGTTLTASAQFKIHGNGKMSFQNPDTVTLSPVSLNYKGDSLYYMAYKGNMDGISCITINNNNDDDEHWAKAGYFKGSSNMCSIGVMGSASTSAGLSYCSVGVLGHADNTGWTYSYGVAGSINADYGAGVYGTSSSSLSQLSSSPVGKYAGYFDGTTKVTGNFYTTGSINGRAVLGNSSTSPGIQNVMPLTTDRGNMTGVLSRLNAQTYYYQTQEHGKLAASNGSDEDNVANESEPDVISEQISKKMHYALSADELEEVFPDLVYEDMDGTKKINYVEMVPLLVQCINELSARLSAIDGGTVDPVSARTRASLVGTSEIDGIPSKSRAVLYQNTPNPFTAQTEIRFSLPDDAPQSYIYVFDMTGKMQKQIPVDPQMQSVTIDGYELQAGIYLYSLVVGGQEIDTKRMILSK